MAGDTIPLHSSPGKRPECGQIRHNQAQMPAADKAFFSGALGNQCDEKVHFPQSLDGACAVHSAWEEA